MSFAVVILNWNGAADTVACLESISAGSDQAHVIVVDNGSTDDSAERIAAALGARGRLLESGENLGFAAGCNLGLRAAQAAGHEVTVFLNNDTVIEPGALDRITQRLLADASCYACLPMLTVHGTDRIWNCGGQIYRIGLRRYHLAGRPRHEGAQRGEIRCSFFTGCCFAVRTAAFAQRGGFSERFFFGEEDFELALWMQAHGLTAVCLTSAVVAHKVSVSFSAAAGSGQNARMFIYYLNRFIHMRLRLGFAPWCLWLAAYVPYVAALLWRRRVMGGRDVAVFVRDLIASARKMDGVTRGDFEAVMAGRLP